ncbi:ABC transporter ATP-binding protein [Gordonia sp. CPCC 206044]|uniref:ABC transporter ATP-binding protein n=1 Tax=Gordonia sp. CPCC 206044 TaxID=3140793 RepID=UPI003AF3C045
MSPRLEVTDLTTTFGAGESAVRALRGVSLSVNAGATLVLLGESGSGKSVTARSILRLYGSSAHSRGTVRFEGRDLLSLSEPDMRSIRGRTIGMVPQDPAAALDPLRSVGAQLAEVLHVHRMTRTRRQTNDRCVELLGLVGIADPVRVLRSRPHQLSGGMRQRVAIAIAVSCQPDVLIADEPTSALDVSVQAQVLELFTELQGRMGMTLVMVTHDVGVAEELDGQVAVMYAGAIVESGTAREVLQTPRHPYTTGLLASLPSPTARRGELTVIGGRPPLTGEVGAGCAFAPRCPIARAECRDEEPPLMQIAPSRSSACPVTTAESPDAQEHAV